MASKFSTKSNQFAAAYEQQTAPTTVLVTPPEERRKNRGSGLGYIGKSALAGLGGVLEGAADLLVGTGALFSGDKAYAQHVFEDDKVGGWQRQFTAEYNPGSVMGFLGDTAAGVGQSSVFLVPHVGAPLFFTGVMGSSTGEAVKTTGELGAKEYAYGILSGATEGALETLTGAGGQAARALYGRAATKAGSSILRRATTRASQWAAQAAWRGVVKNMVSSAAGEFVEEFLGDYTDVFWKRVTGVDPEASTTLGDAMYSGLVGAVSGAFMGGGASAYDAARMTISGNRVISEGNVDATLNTARRVMEGFQTENDANTPPALSDLRTSLAAYDAMADKTSSGAALNLGRIKADLFAVQSYQGVQQVYAELDNAGAQTLDNLAAYMSSRTGKQYSRADFVANKDGIRTAYAIEAWSMLYLGDSRAEADMASFRDIIAADQAGTASGEGGTVPGVAESASWNGSDAVYKASATGNGDSSEYIKIKKLGDDSYSIAWGADAEHMRGFASRTEAEVRDILGEIARADTKATEDIAAYETLKSDMKRNAPELESTIAELQSFIDSGGVGKTAAERRRSVKAAQEQLRAAQAQLDSAPGQLEAQSGEAFDSMAELLRARDRANAGERVNEGVSYTGAEQDAARKLVKDFDTLHPDVRRAVMEWLRSSQSLDKKTQRAVANIIAVRQGLFVLNAELGKGHRGLYSDSLGEGARLAVIDAKQAGEAARDVITHEVTHDLEGVKGYTKLKKAALTSTSEARRREIVDQYVSQYEGAQPYSEWLGNRAGTAATWAEYLKAFPMVDGELIEREVVARAVADKLGSVRFIDKYAERNVLSRAINSLRRLFRALKTAKADETSIAEVVKLGRAFEGAMSKERTEGRGVRTSAHDVAEDTQKYDMSEKNAEYARKFRQSIDAWDQMTIGFSLEIGQTPVYLAELETNGEKIGTKQVRIDASKLMDIMDKHSEMTLDVIKQLPYLLNDPILVFDSKTEPGRLVLFGEVYANGQPVMMVLEPNATTRVSKTSFIDVVKVASAYVRNSTQSLISTSNVRYVNKNRSRVDDWLKVNRLQLPLLSTSGHSADSSVSQPEQNVNSNSKNNLEKNPKYDLAEGEPAKKAEKKATGEADAAAKVEKAERRRAERQQSAETMQTEQEEISARRSGRVYRADYVKGVTREVRKIYGNVFDATMSRRLSGKLHEYFNLYDEKNAVQRAMRAISELYVDQRVNYEKKLAQNELDIEKALREGKTPPKRLEPLPELSELSRQNGLAEQYLRRAYKQGGERVDGGYSYQTKNDRELNQLRTENETLKTVSNIRTQINAIKKRAEGYKRIGSNFGQDMDAVMKSAGGVLHGTTVNVTGAINFANEVLHMLRNEAPDMVALMEAINREGGLSDDMLSTYQEKLNASKTDNDVAQIFDDVTQDLINIANIGQYYTEGEQRKVTPTRGLTLEELKTIEKTMREVIAADTRHGRVYIDGEWVDAVPLAELTVGAASKVYGAGKDVMLRTMTSTGMIETIQPAMLMQVLEGTAGDRHSSLSTMYNEIMQADLDRQVQRVELTKDIDEFMNDGKEINGVKMGGRKYQKHYSTDSITVELPIPGRGKVAVKMTIGEAQAFVMTFKREQARPTFALNAFEFRDRKKRGKDYTGRVIERMEIAEDADYDDVMTRLLNEIGKTVAEVSRQLTDEDRALMRMAEKFFEQSKTIKMGADMTLLGKTNIIAGYYFPILRSALGRDANYINSGVAEYSPSTRSYSWNKKTIRNASGRIVIGELLDIVNSHAEQLTTYANMSIPIQNLQRMVNTRLAEPVSDCRTVREYISRRVYAGFDKYMNKLISDLQGRRRIGNELDAKIESALGHRTVVQSPITSFKLEKH